MKHTTMDLCPCSVEWFISMASKEQQKEYILKDSIRDNIPGFSSDVHLTH